MWKGPPGIRSERHEARDEFRVDPVGLGACPSAGSEGFDLSRRQLPRRDPGIVQRDPKLPLLPAGSLEADQRAQLASKMSDLLVAFDLVRKTRAFSDLPPERSLTLM